MAALAITRARSARPTGQHPKLRLDPDKGRHLTFPYAPRGTTLEGWADAWSTQARPGRKPLVVRDGKGLDVLSFNVLVANLDNQQPIEDLLAGLEQLARSGERVKVLGLSTRERGPWRLAEVTVTGEERQEGSNAITRATVALRFLEASDANPRLGPVTGGKKRKGKGNGKPRKHTITKGDTLRSIADRYYGEPGEWKRIAKRNNITDPDKLKVGQVITIPPAGEASAQAAQGPGDYFAGR